MDSSPVRSGEKGYLDKAIEVAVRLSLIAVIVFSCFKIFQPFMMPVVWAIIIAVALHPLYLRLKNLVGGRRRLAGIIFILFGLVIVIVPTVFLADSLIDGTVRIGRELRDGTFSLAPPSEKVRTWPLIGEKAYDLALLASENIKAATQKAQPQIQALGEWLIASFTALGASVLFSLIAIVIAGILLIHSEGEDRIARLVGRRLGGEMGENMITVAGNTIQSVVKGVILIALIQGLLAGIGMLLAGVPAAGFWAMLVIVAAIIQLPPILILAPVAVYVFSTDMSMVWAVIFAVYALVVSALDGFLKPVLLGRGLTVPMLVILIGAIGGMLSAGVVGLFIGPVIFAIGYEIFALWIKEVRGKDDESANIDIAGDSSQ